MLRIIKKIILWDRVRFPIIKNTFIYTLWHKINGKIANIIYSNPSKQMFVIGVTGTDGKTTTCNLIHHLIQSNIGNCVMVSTTSIKFGSQNTFNDSKMTSLGVYDLNKLLSQAKEQWFQYAVIEVSSHGLSQSRFEGVSFSCGVLTNISAEHLDFHKNLTDYAQTKKQLFLNVIKNNLPNKFAVLPKDDEYGRKWMNEIIFDKQIDYGVTISSTLKGENIVQELDHTTFDIKYLGKNNPINFKLPALFNVYNALAATGVWLLLWLTMEQIVWSLSQFEPVDGRVNIRKHKEITHIVDFAHTPAALKSLLTYLQATKWTWKIITVFGAPWLRDTYKRPEMWAIVWQLSDTIILTEDDSQSEDVFTIIKQVHEGVKRNEWENYFIQPSRATALILAQSIAQPGDCIVYAGKWHERVLLTNFGKKTWNDLEEIKKLLV